MESAILQAEDRVESLEAASQDPSLANDHARATAIYADLAAAQSEVRKLYDRWAELDGKVD